MITLKYMQLVNSLVILIIETRYLGLHLILQNNHFLKQYLYRMKATLICFLSFTLIPYGLVSGKEQDSLYTTIISETNNSTKIEQLSSLAFEIRHDDISNAIKYGEESLLLANKSELTSLEVLTRRNLGLIHSHGQNIDLALGHLLEALEISKEEKDYYSISNAYLNLSRLYEDLEKIDSALYFCHLLKGTKDHINSLEITIDLVEQYSTLYFKKKDFESAYRYQSQYHILRDSFNNIATTSRIKELEAKYQSGINKVENILPQKRHEASKMKAENPYRERYVWAIMIIILIGGIRLLWMQLLQNRNKNNLLNEQKEEIVQKSNEIEKINDAIQKQNNKLQNTLNDLQKTQDQLIESEKIASITILTSGLAHELNNPLNYISGLIGPIKLDLEELTEEIDTNSSENSFFLINEINTLMESLSEGVEKVSGIIKNLLDISPEALPEQARFIELDKILEASIFVVRKNNPVININFDTQTSVVVYCDFAEMSQVFLNVLRNSIDALENTQRPIINVSVTKSMGMATVLISDNGIGMNESMLSKTFQPFFTSKEPGKGTGLGLYISQRIIKKYEGDIHIKSQAGKGTDITIEIPLVSQEVLFK